MYTVRAVMVNITIIALFLLQEKNSAVLATDLEPSLKLKFIIPLQP